MTIKESRNQLQTDQISEVDALGREKFATEIAKSILHHIETSSESLVIGIHGPWGSGKSNLLYFIKENIKKSIFYTNSQEISGEYRGFLKRLLKSKPKQNNRKLYLLEFNPWIFSGKEQLHWSFLNEFALKVRSKRHKLRNKIQSFIDYVFYRKEEEQEAYCYNAFSVDQNADEMDWSFHQHKFM